MPTSSLPENPSLEHLKGQAKLVRDLIRTSDPDGLQMIDEFHPRLTSADLDETKRERFKTADAQLIVARLYRFSSWNRLREHVAVVNAHSFTPGGDQPSEPDPSTLFIQMAGLYYAKDGPGPEERIAAAHRMLEADPSLATGSIEALATVGDHQTLSKLLDDSPDAVNKPCGPNGWSPLMYATYSRFFVANPDWSAVETVKVLLSRGADPNAGFLWSGLVPPFTALTGAFGGGENHQPWHPERLIIGRRLLEAGADPNDGQLLYNNGIGGQNHDDPGHLQLLVEFGLGTQHNGPWYQLLGTLLRDPAELLYDEVEAAAKRNRPKILAYLASLGLDLDRPVGRSQLTPTRIAAAEDHGEILAVLAEAGINTELTPTEEALRHSRANQTSKLRQLLSSHPPLLNELRAAYPGLCANVAGNHASMLELLIELGFDINDRSHTKTPLHHAAESNDVERTRLLLEYGADPNLIDTYIGAPAWGWANHFGHAETAAYLHPLTHHGDPLPEITVRFTNTSHTLATPDLIDKLLDRIHQEASKPVLVRLGTGEMILTIGLGHPDFSVALFRDADKSPWHAAGDPTPVHGDSISFISPDDGHVYDFNPVAFIEVPTALAIAREFCQEPAVKPPSVVWQPEGFEPSDHAPDQPT